MLSLFKVFMSVDVLAPVNSLLMSGKLTQGPEVEEFESRLKEFFNNNTSPVGKGNRQKVKEGDQLLMGTYNIQVSIIDDEFDTKEAASDISTDDLFSDLLEEPSDVISTVEDKISDTSGFSPQGSQYNESSIGSDDPFFESGEFLLNDNQVIPTNIKENHEDIPDLDSFFKPPNIINQDDTGNVSNEVKDEKKLEINEPEKAHIPSVIPDDWIGGGKNTIDDLLTGIVDPFAVNEASSDEKSQSESDNILKKSPCLRHWYQH